MALSIAKKRLDVIITYKNNKEEAKAVSDKIIKM
jgi:hypothetical protein